MADETISGQEATREQAKRDQTQAQPLTLTIQYDPTKAPPPPGEPEAQAGAAPTGAGAVAAPAPGEAAATPEAPQAVAKPAEAQPQSVVNDAKLAFEQIIRQFLKDVGVTQPLGEKGPLEQAVGSPGQTTGDVTDLIRRVARGLDLGIQVASAPVVGAGTLAQRVTEQAAPLPYQAAKAAGVPVPESLTKVQETGASRAVKEFTQALASLATGPGAMVGPLAKQAGKRAVESGTSLALKGEARAALAEQRGSLGLPAMPPQPAPRRPPTIRPATAQEAETALAADGSTLQVGDKLMSIKWGDMNDEQAIQNTVKTLRSLYTEKHAIPMEATRALADDLRAAGFEDKVLTKALVEGKTRAEAQALMDISKKGIERTNELREQLRAMQPGSPEYQRTFQEFQVQLGISGRYVQLLDDLIGEAGGTLRMAQETARTVGGERLNWMRDYAEKVSKGLIRDVDLLPELWDALPRPEMKWQFTRLATKHGWDILRELSYDSMLFTFKGQMANLIGNGVMLKRPVDLTLASGIGTLRNALVGGEKAIPLEQALASGQGMLAALTEAHWAAWETFLTGQSRFGAEFKSVQGAITGARFAETLAAKNITLADPLSKFIDRAGFTMGIGNRALGAGDEYLKLVHYSGYSYELAAKDALRQGASTRGELNAHMRTYLRNMPDDAKHEAAAYAHYATYTEPLSGILKWMSQATDSPFLVGFIPFFTTLANVVRVGFEHLPGLNLLVKRSREDLFAGGTRTDMALAKIAEGTALGLIASWWYDVGKLTGRRPTNKGAAKVLQDMGWEEDAIAFYDDEGKPTGYMSINRMDPVNQAFILYSHMRDLMADMGADSLSWEARNEMAVASVLAVGEYVENISFMRGVKDAIEIYTTSDIKEADKRRTYLARRAASLAVPSGLGQITQMVDPYMRETSDFSDMVCARTPWCSTGLYPQRKLNGEPRLRLEAIGPKWLEFASPLPYSKANPDPVSTTMVENNMAVTFPSRVIMGRNPDTLQPPNPARDGIKLTNAQFDLYQRLAGNELKIPAQALEGVVKALGYEGPSPRASGPVGMWDLLTAIVETDFYKKRLTNGSPGGKERVVLGIMSHFRQAAIRQMVMKEKELLGADYDPAHDFRTQFINKKLGFAEAVGGPDIRQQAEQALQRSGFFPAPVSGAPAPRMQGTGGGMDLHEMTQDLVSKLRDLPTTLNR